MVGPPRLSGVFVRPLNFTVRRDQVVLVPQYRCQLERLGAPHWACATAGIILALAAAAYLFVITKAFWGRTSTPVWFFPLICALNALAIVLAVRSVVKVLRSNSNTGAAGPGRAGPSNNRWRGP